MTAKPAFVLLLTSLWLSLSCGEEPAANNDCSVDDDCWNSDAAHDLGRCGPQDVVCKSETCEAWCTRFCQVDREDVNPCGEPFICNQPRSATTASDDWICQARPISCQTVDDCPAYLPNGGGSGWECLDSVCRYPGFQYYSER